MVARSGIIPRYQNSMDATTYVNSAMKSHSSGDFHCGHSVIVFGYGNSQ